MAKIEHIKNKRGEVIYPVSKEGAIYDENGVLLSTKIATFITRLVDNLANYYLKSETYTKGEVDELIGAIQGFTYIVVSELPTASAETMGIVYLVPSEDPQTQNVKDEYITIRSGVEGSYTYSWEQIGSTAIDLSGYVTTEALNTTLADYTTTANLTTLLAGKQDTISDLATIRSGAAAGATAYQKPGTGIPATDMASGVQTSLGKADSAYQKPSGGIPKTDLESGVQGSLELADTAVQADPIGSIVPPVDPSEFATKEEVEELEAKVDEKFHAPDTEVGTFDNGYYNTNADTLPSGRNNLNGCKSAKITVIPGQLYKIYGEALNNNYYRFYAFYDANGDRIDRYSSSGLFRDTPLNVTVPASSVTMVVNLGNYASATDKVVIPGEEYSLQEISEAIEETDENVVDLTTDVGDVATKVSSLESTIIEGASVKVKGLSTSNLVLNDAIELSQNGDELEVKVENIDADSNWFSFSNSGVSTNSYYAIALGRASIDIRATDGTWICGTTAIPYADKHTIKITYSNGNIYTYVDDSLVHTFTGLKTIRLSSFGNGGNGTYGYWKGTIVSVKHNSTDVALYEQQVNDAIVSYKYRFVKWSDISGLDVLPIGVLKYDATNKVFDFFQRYGKTDKYFSFRVRLNEDNSDLVYLKEWRLSEGMVWSYTGETFTEIAQTIYDAENEMAMRFSGTADYTGGIHGDERIDVSPLSFVRFYADGRLITAEEMQNDFTIECASFCYMQMSTLHETSATAETFVPGHPIVAYHYKRNTFEDCASKLENIIKFASQQKVTQYHAGMMCVGKGAGLYAILPGMVSTPELSGTNDDYDADDLSASRVDMWNPTTGVRCFVDGVLTQGIENTDIQQFEVWDRTTDSKYYRRMVKGDSVAPVFEENEFIRNEQTIKFY